VQIADELLGPSQAARVVGCSPQTIKNMVSDGRLPGVRSGIGVLVTRQDAERVAAERQARQGSGPSAA
jgi:excisionase family DNA binding protein